MIVMGVEDQEKPVALEMLDGEEEGDGSRKREALKDDTNGVSTADASEFVEKESPSKLEHDHFPLPMEHDKDDSGLLVDEQGLLYIQECFGFGNMEQDQAFLSIIQDTQFRDNRYHHSSKTHNNNTANNHINDSSANDEVRVETKGTKSKNAASETPSSSTSEGDDNKRFEQQPALYTKPKRPMSAYNHFFKMKRAELVRQQPDIQFADIGKVIGKAWKALGAQDLKIFERLANRDMVRYRRQIELWRQLRRLRLKGGGTIGSSNGGRVVSIATVEDVNGTKVPAEVHNDKKEENHDTQRPACSPIYRYDQHDTARCSNKSPTTAAASFQGIIKEQKEGNTTPPSPFFSWPPDAVATQTSHPEISPTAAVVSPCCPFPLPLGVHNNYGYYHATPPYSMNSSPPPPASQHQPFPYYHGRYGTAHLHDVHVAPPPLPLHHHGCPPSASYSSSDATGFGEFVTPGASPRRQGFLFRGSCSSPLDYDRQRGHCGNDVDASLSCFEDAAAPHSKSSSSVSPLPFVAPSATYHNTSMLCPTSQQSSCDSGSKDQSTTATAAATAPSCASLEQEALQKVDGQEDKQGAWMRKPAAYPGPLFLPNSTQQPGTAYWPPPEGFAHHYYHRQEYGLCSTLHQNNPQYIVGSTAGLNHDGSQYYVGTAGLNQHHPCGNFQVSYKCVRMQKSQVKDYMAHFYQQLEEAT